jgi:hypothetical protein
LVVAGLYIGILSSFSQKVDSAVYKSRKLKLDEINLVSSYYRQDGNTSAVDGGIGSEKLTDIANVIEVKLTKYDKRNHKHTLTGELGVDHYTSASSDKIDTKANSSASSADTRFYPSVSWNVENEQKGNSLGFNVSASTEFDYKSLGFGANFSQKSKDKNRELSIKLQAYLDKVSLILPVELRTGTANNDNNYPAASRNSYSGSFSLSQVINKSLQLLVVLDVVKQQGFLGLPFHRVFLNDGTLRSELLPSSRLKLPIGLRANYFLGDKIIIRSFYRFYKDNWGLTSNNIELESSFKLTPFFSVTPFYRFYDQTAVDYFAPYKTRPVTAQFYTSNYDLSKFKSNFLGTGFRISPPKGVLGMQHWNMLEIRYGHYNRTTGLNSDIISLNLKFK